LQQFESLNEGELNRINKKCKPSPNQLVYTHKSGDKIFPPEKRGSRKGKNFGPVFF